MSTKEEKERRPTPADSTEEKRPKQESLILRLSVASQTKEGKNDTKYVQRRSVYREETTVRPRVSFLSLYVIADIKLL